MREYYRSWDYGTEGWKDLDQITMVRMTGRQYRNVGGDNYEIHLRFEADDRERIYGMGQYQQPYLNLKGCTLDMEQKNTQASVPFMVSDRGYGLLWKQSGRWTGILWKEPDGIFRTVFKADRLLDHSRGYAGRDCGKLYGRHGKGSHDAGVRHGLLAVQASLSDPGGNPVCGAGVP